MTALRRLWRADEGAALVEYALIMPALLTMIFGLMQLGCMAWTQVALNYAVQEAARCAAVRTDVCGTSSAIQTYAASQTLGLNIPASVFQAQLGQGCGTDVRANLAYNFIVSPFSQPTANLTAEVCHS